MQDSFDFRSLVKKYPELPFALFAVLSYCISVIFAIAEWGGTRDFYGIEIHLISTPLWVIFGLASIYFLYEAFFDLWIYAIHLIFAYFLTGAGVLALYVFRDDYRIMNSNDPESARERFSLHSWYIFPFVFFGLCVVSFLDLGYWYENPDHSPYIHFLAEFSLIVTLVYMLWKPENVLFYGTREATDELSEDTTTPSPTGTRTPRSSGHAHAGGSYSAGDGEETGPDGAGGPTSIASRLRRGRKVENCPGFDSPPITTRKSCPGCGTINDFAWCPQSEEYLIDCQICERKTYHGRKVCIHCKSPLQEKVSCSSCSMDFPIRRFKEIP